jgi:hypothetical protein
MLFQIINCQPEDFSEDLQKRLALSNILTSHGMRKNIVISTKETMRAVISSSDFGTNENAFSQDVLDNLKQHIQLIDELDFYVQIDFENGGLDCTTNNGKTVVRIGHSSFIESQNSDALSLITEGSNDHIFYSHVAKYYSNHISPLKLNLKFNERPGSGSRSKSEFDRLSRDNKLLLCIVDNDKKHPNKGEGSTSGIFTESDRSIDSTPLVKVLKVREIESLIPHELISQIVGKATSPRIDSLDEFISLADSTPQFRVYFDHKEGITLKEAIELDNAHGAFWLDILSRYERFSSKDCFKNKVCSNCNTCPKIGGFGDGLLGNTITFFDSYNLGQLKKQLEPSLIPYWEDIGKILMSWGCSGTGRVVRG